MVKRMADILFAARHKGPNSKTHHRLGDPIVAMPGNHTWGPREDKRVWVAAGKDPTAWPGDFFILRIKGLTVRRARRFIEPHYRPATAVDLEFGAPDADDRKVLVRRKRWRLVLSELPGALRKRLRRNGYASVTLGEVRPFFRHRYHGGLISA